MREGRSQDSQKDGGGGGVGGMGRREKRKGDFFLGGGVRDVYPFELFSVSPSICSQIPCSFASLTNKTSGHAG